MDVENSILCFSYCQCRICWTFIMGIKCALCVGHCTSDQITCKHVDVFILFRFIVIEFDNSYFFTFISGWRGHVHPNKYSGIKDRTEQINMLGLAIVSCEPLRSFSIGFRSRFFLHKHKSSSFTLYMYQAIVPSYSVFSPHF